VLIFLSYNHADKETARRLGVHLKIVGADVWFDEWEVRAGDSIPGKLNAGLAAFEIFVLLWSEHASRSDWVRAELHAAIQHSIENSAVRIVPVRLDVTEPPALLRPFKWLDLRDPKMIDDVITEVMGFRSERERIRAIQEVLDSLEIEIGFFHGYGPMAGCPRCGAGLKAIEGWSQIDYERDNTYAGARCRECGWNDGGEV
jgi:DNA-directed RNA polymerase subunit RPC12/RpoP